MKTIAGNSYLKKEEDNILLDLIPLNEILTKNRTPILVFLENRIRENIKTFLEIFDSVFENFSCLYSFKANYLPEICNIIQSENIGAEVVGLLELKLALKLKFSPHNIIVGGPYLPKELIKICLENQVKEIVIYDLNDIREVDSIAKKHNSIQNICIRINSGKYNSNLGVYFNKQNLLNLKKIIKECDNIKITTVLSHYSTQMNNVELFIKNVENLAKNLNYLSKNGINIESINLGGGFPEATVMNKNQLKRIAQEIKSTLIKQNIQFNNIYFEPGRYFLGDAGFFIANIIKVSKNRKVFLNIGNHICPKFAKCSLRFYNASQISLSHNEPTTFFGIIPTDQDVLAKDFFFTENLVKGDKVLITNTGAYCLTFSNRFPYLLPKILLVSNDSYTIIFDPRLNGDFSLN
ncbi:MAG: alanine racemase [Promethearchaeota archaeon]